MAHTGEQMPEFFFLCADERANKYISGIIVGAPRYVLRFFPAPSPSGRFYPHPYLFDAREQVVPHAVPYRQAVGTAVGEKKLLFVENGHFFHRTALSEPFTVGVGQVTFDGVVGYPVARIGMFQEKPEVLIRVIAPMPYVHKNIVAPGGVGYVIAENQRAVFVPPFRCHRPILKVGFCWPTRCYSNRHKEGGQQA